MVTEFMHMQLYTPGLKINLYALAALTKHTLYQLSLFHVLNTEDLA